MSEFISEIINRSRLKDVNDRLVEAELIIGETIVKTVNEYSKELDELINALNKKVKQDEYESSDKELEKLIFRLPVLIYELNNMVIKAGIKEDLSKIIKQYNYNQVFVQQEGTIADKRSISELMTKEEQLLETTWKRAVKIINQKIDIANELLSSCKKILSKRMINTELLSRNNYLHGQ